MNEQKFMPGDLVKIRRFDEIDTADIGNHRFDAEICFGIERSYIDSLAGRGLVYTIGRIFLAESSSYNSYDYTLEDEDGNEISYWWAQGMIDFASPQEELPEPDEEGLFAFLSV